MTCVLPGVSSRSSSRMVYPRVALSDCSLGAAQDNERTEMTAMMAAAGDDRPQQVGKNPHARAVMASACFSVGSV